jgi:hypothetical protein
MEMKFGGFNKKLSFEPQNIRSMSMDQKRDCMDELESRKKAAARYSLLFFLGVAAYSFLRNFYNFLYTLRESELLNSSVSPLILIVPSVIVLLAFFADILSSRTVVVSMLAYAAFGGYLIIAAKKETFIVELLPALFSFAGMFVYRNLLEVCDAHKILKNEEGYPDFFRLPTKDEVASVKNKD